MYKIYAELRDARGMTDYEVGMKTGIAAATFTRWKGGGTPRLEKLQKIADLFGVTIDELVGR